MATGELTVQPSLLPMTPVARLFALRSGVPWPHGYPTVAELDSQIHLVSPSDFSKAQADLIERLELFAVLPQARLASSHPLLGPMTHWEWMRWGFLHTDHHLRQFGC